MNDVTINNFLQTEFKKSQSVINKDYQMLKKVIEKANNYMADLGLTIDNFKCEEQIQVS